MKRYRKTFCLITLLFCLFAFVTVEAGTDATIFPSQVGATQTTITISWPKVAGASYYNFQAVSVTDDVTGAINVNLTTTEAVIDSVPRDTIYRYIVFAFDSLGQELGRSSVYEAAAAPGPMKNCGVIRWNASGKVGTFGILSNLYPNTLSGIEWEIWDRKKTKKLCSGMVNEGALEFSAKLKNNQVYYLNVRGFVNNSGKIFYGSWAMSAVVPEPKLYKPKYLQNQGIRLTWSKVAGANRYILYASDKKGGGFKKTAVIRGGKTSYTISKVKGSALIPGKTYYFKVKAAKKRSKSTLNQTRSITIPGA